jgi:putative phage-type endonuclease
MTETIVYITDTDKNISELIDITDLIVPEEDPSYFNEEEYLELHDVCLQLMEEFITSDPLLISEADFDEMFDENINEMMHAHFDFDIFYTEDAISEMNEIIHHAKKEFFSLFICPRSYSCSAILEKPNIETISKIIAYLKNKPQPVQRTKEWYDERQNMLTASIIHKCFESQSVQNQLIYEKAFTKNKDVDETSSTSIKLVNTNTSLHHGQKYEPVSVNLYEYTYETKIGDFGCIKHDKYSFIGASPDGINIDPNSDRYGRMLEIKNIVNREIDGIPKKEYWIQMQIQMEVCNLDECDFLETKFNEYESRDEFLLDIELESELESESKSKNVCLSKDGKRKGIILHFHTKDGSPYYAYKPLNLETHEEITKWQEETIDYHQTNNNYIFMKTIYWKLEIFNCVLVCRNKMWFNSAIPVIERIWQIIETERVTGCEHRAPNRKPKKEQIDSNKPENVSKCLLQFKKFNVIKIPDTDKSELDTDNDTDTDNSNQMDVEFAEDLECD